MITRLFPQQPRNFKSVFTLFYIMWGLIFGFLISGCDGGSDGPAGPTGKLAFHVQWGTLGVSAASAVPEGDNSTQLAAMECEENGIFWVNAVVYDGSNNEYLTESELWHCDAHGGTIPFIPVGANRKIVLFGNNAEHKILYRGEVGNITVSANAVNNVGLINASYFVPTEGSYNIESETFSWKSVAGASSYQLQVSRNIGFTDIEIDKTVDRASSGASGLFSLEDTHYWRVRSIDFDKRQSAWSHIWHFGAPPDNQVGPEVLSTAPRNGEENVSRNLTLVTVLFDKPMDVRLGNVDVEQRTEVWEVYDFESTRAWDNSGQRLYIYGSFTETQSDRFRFRLTGFRDPDGNLLNPNPYEFEFTIATTSPQVPPQVVFSDPSNGATVSCYDLQNFNSNVNIVFSKPMNISAGVIRAIYTIEVEHTDHWPFQPTDWSSDGLVLTVMVSDNTREFVCGTQQVTLNLSGFMDTEGLALSPEPTEIIYNIYQPEYY